MPLLKRKPVLMHPLPSLTAIVQPVHAPLPNAQASTSGADASPSAAATAAPPPPPADLPKDGKDDDEQLEKLLTALNDPVIAAPLPKRSQKDKAADKANGAVNGSANGTVSSMPPPAGPVPSYRVKNVEVFYIPETGEMFLDYESFALRRAFYEQPLFQCEVSGKSSLSYFKALQNESREVRQLHSRFPRQLKKAVLQSVQFQIEGKLETLADRIFERFVNRFFDDEKVFVDVQGDKYLARIVHTFPPKNLVSPTDGPSFHPYATDLTMSNDEVNERDDPMKYFYQVRLIEEGGEGITTEYASTNGASNDPEDDDKGEKWQGSVMEAQADKISRDRINFSRALLKRFIRDCVARDAAIYSPWLVKKSVAARYGLPTEMSDEVRAAIDQHRRSQMEKRKRDRDERLGIVHNEDEETGADDEAPAPKKKKMTKAERDALREAEKEEKERIKREAKEAEEEEKKKKKPTKYPCEDLMVEFNPERDGPAGRIEVRPTPDADVPFGDQFEAFLMSWSFLNVMGKPLGLSPFTVDDYEQALYHSDPYTSPVPLLTEIHAVLLNALVTDLADGHDEVKPLSHTGQQIENDTDYWEGTKGSTAETLRPVAEPMAKTWRERELSTRDNRKGWEAALVGCLWDRATLDTLPHYLDNILHLTFENKPAPTRPTWSTGPRSDSGGSGLIVAKPDKRYTSLHHTHKLRIIDFLIELVAQTAVIRDFMEDATQQLTEVRKDQIEARREWRRVRAERDALEPKEEKKEDKEDGDGDVPMSDPIKGENESRPASPNGHANGTAANTEADELDESMMDDHDHGSPVSSPLSESAPAQTGAQRRRAMKEKAAEREAEEAMKAAKAAKQREEDKIKRAESKHILQEKKRLDEEEAVLDTKLRQLDRDFRRFYYTLRARPLGSDRYGNKVWWMDGLGSSPLPTDNAKGMWGSARLYLQGADELEVEFARQPAELTTEELEERRNKDEGLRLQPGQWAVYDTPEQLEAFLSWLNPRGVRELHLQRALKQWWPEIEGSFHKRRLALGIEKDAEEETSNRRVRPVRRAAGGDEPAGYLSWKNRRASGKGE